MGVRWAEFSPSLVECNPLFQHLRIASHIVEFIVVPESANTSARKTLEEVESAKGVYAKSSIDPCVGTGDP